MYSLIKVSTARINSHCNKIFQKEFNLFRTNNGIRKMQMIQKGLFVTLSYIMLNAGFQHFYALIIMLYSAYVAIFLIRQNPFYNLRVMKVNINLKQFLLGWNGCFNWNYMDDFFLIFGNFDKTKVWTLLLHSGSLYGNGGKLFWILI